ncbi:MAG: alpha/beta hydrolase [Pseudomonadota bacterium]
MGDIAIRRAFADTELGQIHYVTAGKGKPVILLHQTPRSWDEYREVLPIIGRKYRAVAMDTIGFGDSFKPKEPGSIERYAKAVIGLMDRLGIEKTSIVGHHTGGVIALEVAASFPHRVDKLVLSSTPFIDASERELRKNRPPVDEDRIMEDGSHLTDIWRKRMPFYPKSRPDLLTRFVRDALKVWDRLEEGHRAVGMYRMEEKIDRIKAPTLLIGATDDPFAYPHLKQLAGRIRGCKTAEIRGGMVPLAEQMPEEFARLVMDFLDERHPAVPLSSD